MSAPVVYPKFGSSTPFAEPNWYQGYATTYYKPTHVAYREKVRAFVEKELMPYVHDWDEVRFLSCVCPKQVLTCLKAGTYPRELHQKVFFLKKTVFHR